MAGFIRQFFDMHIAGRDHTPRRGNADLGFFKIIIVETHCPKHGSGGCFFNTVDHFGGVFAFVSHLFVCLCRLFASVYWISFVKSLDLLPSSPCLAIPYSIACQLT